MIVYEDNGVDHVYTIGTKTEILRELTRRIEETTNDSKKGLVTDYEYIEEVRDLSSLAFDVWENAKERELIFLTADTPSGELGWGIVSNIDFDMRSI